VNADPNIPINQMPGSLRSELPRSTAALETSSRDSESNRYTGLQLWMRRLAVLMFVFLCATAGVLLIILPWRPEWTDNHLLLGSPWLRAFISSGFVRGLCSGFGLLDIWIGFWEAVHYHEERRY
jgi:hypothetical protein